MRWKSETEIDMGVRDPLLRRILQGSLELNSISATDASQVPDFCKQIREAADLGSLLRAPGIGHQLNFHAMECASCQFLVRPYWDSEMDNLTADQREGIRRLSMALKRSAVPSWGIGPRRESSKTANLRMPSAGKRAWTAEYMVENRYVIHLCLLIVLLSGAFFSFSYIMGRKGSDGRVTVEVDRSGSTKKVKGGDHLQSVALNSSPLIVGGGYRLQLAALTKEADAVELASQLQKKEFPAFVVMPQQDKYYRVQVGPYGDRKSADAARRGLERAGFKSVIALEPLSVAGQTQTTISGAAYNLLGHRVAANQGSFYVYQDQDSGFNHGFPSGFFASAGNLGTIHIDSGCIDDSTALNGCSTDPNALDRTRGTVMRVSFDPQASGNFAGVNIEEPENYGVLLTGNGYNLSGASNVVLDVRSPDNAAVQFGVGQCVTSTFIHVPQNWTTMTIPLNSLVPAPTVAASCPPTLNAVHFLFTIVTNDVNAPHGATVLLDNIHFDPVPTSQTTALGFPLGNQTFGVVPLQNVATGRVPIPPDQVLRNLSTTYESAVTELALLARGNSQDLANAKLVADTFDYALHHDSHGDPLPAAADGSIGLHNGYENGDIALFNGQQAPKLGQAGDVRLAGFTATTLCPATGFCLVLDGATGGNDAFAILALVSAYEQIGDVRYLNDAMEIADWVVANVTDTTGTGYGGYFLGYPDVGVPPPKPLQTGKSIENNADIFAAFTALANVESQLGNSSTAATLIAEANVAGDFVMQLFDPATGSFYAGTVPIGTPASPGIAPNGPQKGNDVINTFDFLDSNTFVTLAMASAPRYRNQIDWRRPVQHLANTFSQCVTAAGSTFCGFDIVQTPTAGPNGVAWEFTGQAVVAMRFVDQLYGVTDFESTANSTLAQIQMTQSSAPFGDSNGLVASTLEGGDTLPPLDQCLSTPFQCIPERVGLAATNWAVFADQKLNVFSPFALPSLSTTSLTFSAQLVTTSSAGQVATLSNAGSQALAIQNIASTGDFAVSTTGTSCSTGTSLSAGGSCAINTTFTPTTVGSRTASLTISGSGGFSQAVFLSGVGTDFSLAAAPGGSTSATVKAGQTATYNLQVDPLSGFTGSVSLTCTGAPALATCNPSSSTVSVTGASPTPFSVSVTTTGPSAASVGKNGRPWPPHVRQLLLPCVVLALAIFLAAALKAVQDSRPRLVRNFVCVAALLVCFAALMTASGCGGGGSGGGNNITPSGTFTLRVTGTQQGVSRGPVNLTLIVN